ncbi:triacylglycerol lipase: pancreatic-like protein [Leptotrombidium deliense]|uniref:Triacylglycerol lipase: pancreatic-like protein n=1 Tax=Leptotrombidium deliense TaxID=299467 RepID=A0A443SIF4_9ACAR|nr:triacylglycerol lipase: pancreatic-like protein [Leptotrombidium deliense]
MVRVVHTDAGHRGTVSNNAHIDIYPDGGSKAPSCLTKCIPYIYDLIPWDDCNHSRVEYLTSIDYQKFGVCQPVAYECENYASFLRGKCGNYENNSFQSYAFDFQLSSLLPVPVTEDVSKKNRQFYVKTSAEAPFCVHHYQIRLKSREHLVCNSLRISLLSKNYRVSVKVAKTDQTSMTALLTLDWKTLNNPVRFVSAIISNCASNCSNQIDLVLVDYMSNINKGSANTSHFEIIDKYLN